MSTIAQRTVGVDTLAAWLTAYLAAPASADKASFTMAELMAAAGFRPGIAADELAMRKALVGSELRPARLVTGNRARVWARQPIAPGLDLAESTFLQGPSWLRTGHGKQGPHCLEANHPATDRHAHCAQAQHQQGVPLGQTAHHSNSDPGPCGLSCVESTNVAAPAAHSLVELADRAREAVQQTAESAAARHWAFYREGSLDILGRLSCGIAIHKLQATQALDIPEARP